MFQISYKPDENLDNVSNTKHENLENVSNILQTRRKPGQCFKYRVFLSVLDPRKCEYLTDYSLDFEHAYMTTYLAS
jgi:hypothetical protein